MKRARGNVFAIKAAGSGVRHHMSARTLPAAAFALLLAALPAGCSGPRVVERAADRVEPALGAGFLQMPDGYRLPLRTWGKQPGREPEIVLLALHGFNDYGRAFEALGRHLGAEGIRVYAIDQRGFGASAQPRRWHGGARLAADLRVAAGLLRERHPDARLVLVGESMGGAVILAAAADGPLPADGVVLIAPAVWARSTMPWYQRAVLAGMIRVAPGLTLTGQGVEIRPSDNIAMLRAMGADPLVIKGARVDALWGVTNLMDSALQSAPSLRAPTLLLYGARDDIIPRPAFCAMLPRLQPRADLRLVIYEQGWHMLPRDRQGARVREDILAWLRDPRQALPSGEETAIDSADVRGFCADAVAR